MYGYQMLIEQSSRWECFQTVATLLLVCFAVEIGDCVFFDVIHEVDVLCECFMAIWTLFWEWIKN